LLSDTRVARKSTGSEVGAVVGVSGAGGGSSVGADETATTDGARGTDACAAHAGRSAMTVMAIKVGMRR
jgi:hypothetical protein